MTKFNISNALSGAFLGTYEGENVQEALDAMARDAGYADYAAACAVAPAWEGEIVAEAEVDPLYLCLAMSNSQSVKRSAGLIADAPICEGVEGIEFSAEQLAGQWAADYAMSSDMKLADIDEDTLDAYLDIVEEHCQEEGVTINFSHAAALAHALKIVRAYQANEEPELAFL